jgi:hypothetical protein
MHHKLLTTLVGKQISIQMHPWEGLHLTLLLAPSWKNQIIYNNTTQLIAKGISPYSKHPEQYYLARLSPKTPVKMKFFNFTKWNFFPKKQNTCDRKQKIQLLHWVKFYNNLTSLNWGRAQNLIIETLTTSSLVSNK